MALFEDILVIFVGKSSKTYHIEDLTGNFVGKSSNTVHFRDLNRGGRAWTTYALNAINGQKIGTFRGHRLEIRHVSNARSCRNSYWHG